jgi:uncharacterized protein
MTRSLIVFAKAPRPGLAKTRLQPALGSEGAAALAERLLAHTLAQAVVADVGPVDLCVTPDADHPAFTRLAAVHGAALTLQGEGDLGARMERATRRALATRRAVLLIGTDAPALDAAMLRAAASALDEHDAVFVPALDGGYALVGLRQPTPTLFAGIAWSTPSVMADSRARAMAAGLRWAELPPVADIDEPADLCHLPVGWLP